MTAVCLACLGAGALAFVLMFLSDYGQVLRGDRRAGALFPLGGALLGLSTAVLAADAWRRYPHGPLSLLWAAGALCMLGLLIHTLFFALPAGGSSAATAQKDELRPLVNTGVFALCRHPGVLFLGGFYACLWGALGGWALGAAFLLFTLLDAAYAAWQGEAVFPRSIRGYAAYRAATPRFIPTPASLRRCLRTLKLKKQTGKGMSDHDL